MALHPLKGAALKEALTGNRVAGQFCSRLGGAGSEARFSPAWGRLLLIIAVHGPTQTFVQVPNSTERERESVCVYIFIYYMYIYIYISNI